jgi:integrase/recombinase XerD
VPIVQVRHGCLRRSAEGVWWGYRRGFALLVNERGLKSFVYTTCGTFASWLVMDGVSLYVVKELFGHSSISVTERYVHLSPDQGRAAVQKLLLF